MDLLRRLEHNISSRELLHPGEPALLAVSGGEDSMVLLRLMHQSASRQPRALAVAHFNHLLRGSESDADAAFVEEESRQLGIPFYSSSGDARRTSETEGISIEMAARKLRHHFFAALAGKLRIKTVILAHHADDQVETFWLRLLRGSAGEGLGGMRWRSPSPANPDIHLVRPLLDVPKSGIRNHAESNQIPFRLDATNDSRDFLRNKIRLHLLPLIEREYQPGLKSITLRLAEVLRDEKGWIAAMAAAWLDHPSEPYAQLPPALQRAVVHSQLIRLNLPPTFDLIEALRSAPDQPVSIAPDQRVVRDESGRLRSDAITPRPFLDESTQVGLSESGSITWNALQLSWSIQPEPLVQRIPGTEMFDADRVGPVIRLRHWQPADRFQPIGMSRPTKLQDLFTNLKIDPSLRRALVLAETADRHIFWVESIRVGETCKVSPSTRRFLHWHWTRLPLKHLA